MLNVERQARGSPKTSSSHFMAFFRDSMAYFVFGRSSFCTQMHSLTCFPDLVMKVSSRPARLPATRANK